MKSSTTLTLFAAIAFTVAQLSAQTYTFSTFAGTPSSIGSTDGIGASARFNSPQGVAVDSAGNIFVADWENTTIRKITPAAVVTTFAGLAGVAGQTNGLGSDARFSSPAKITVDSAGNLYVTDIGNDLLRKITAGGNVTTLAGNGTYFYTDGVGMAAGFDSPGGLAIDGGGNLYVADRFAETIRKITPATVVTTFAGAFKVAGSTDGTSGSARFNTPNDIAVDRAGNVYITDTDNRTIRKITPAGVVTTLAGLADQNAAAIDGTGAAARFNTPLGLTIDGNDNLYVSDLNSIRKITPAGVVTTLAGVADQFGSADGAGNAVRFNFPSGVAVDASGNLYVADTGNHTIRKGTLTNAPALTTQPVSQIVAAGGTAIFFVVAPTATTYQWMKDGAAISGATGATLSLSNVQASAVGNYTCVVSNASGSTTSNLVTLAIDNNAIVPRLVNISTRSYVGTNDSVQIAGFIIGGTQAKSVLIRASGPALTQYNVPGVLADPVLTLYNGSLQIAQNDDWGADPSVPAFTAATGAPAFAQGSKDSALAMTLQPGAYTAIVSGKTNGTGVALVEVFEADGTSSGSKLVNISTRSQVMTSDQVQIAGFIINGSSAKKLLIRASGPALVQYGVAGTLVDPVITLYSGSNQIGQNDDWSSDPNVPAYTSAAGAVPFAQGSKDSALAVTLQPGAYTAIVTGKNDTTGVALIEVFEVP